MNDIDILTEFQDKMKGKADKAGLMNEEDVTEWIMTSRYDDKDYTRWREKYLDDGDVRSLSKKAMEYVS